MEGERGQARGIKSTQPLGGERDQVAGTDAGRGRRRGLPGFEYSSGVVCSCPAQETHCMLMGPVQPSPSSLRVVSVRIRTGLPSSSSPQIPHRCQSDSLRRLLRHLCFTTRDRAFADGDRYDLQNILSSAVFIFFQTPSPPLCHSYALGTAENDPLGLDDSHELRYKRLSRPTR
ncbi:hypothetical protein BD309DRAFT_387579 [Dichomitus squalens]|nr:hypothetical protein BD309DRAFT_387579 [Dichomitus squalens]